MIISFQNEKGGVGKTTLSINFAWQAAIQARRVLLVDADPQQSLTKWTDKRKDPLLDNISVISMPKRTIHRDIGVIADDYDLVVIDGTPRSGDIARSVILASDAVIIPCLPCDHDVEATYSTLLLIDEAKMSYRPLIKSGIIINRKVANTILSKTIASAIDNMIPSTFLFPMEICNRIIYGESGGGQTIQELGTDKKAEIEMMELFIHIREMIYGN
jgi:chromosome partitioning protein